ncbi:unnamed protein product, partial [Brassica rapa subsp. narinosa]
RSYRETYFFKDRLDSGYNWSVTNGTQKDNKRKFYFSFVKKSSVVYVVIIYQTTVSLSLEKL